MKKDDLGNRMKNFYESRTNQSLIRRTYTIVRLDGKAFHTYTKGLEKPFDKTFIDDMNATAIYLCKNIQGVKLAFVQSDEISIVMTDFDKLSTEAYYDNNIQKIVSVTASMATAAFNDFRRISRNIGRANSNITDKYALFDSRVFTIPCKTEVINYLIWRQLDAIRNSILSVAQSVYSNKLMHGKNTAILKIMLCEDGKSWENYPLDYQRGRVIIKKSFYDGYKMSSDWFVSTPEIFTEDLSTLDSHIPDYL